MKRYIVSSCVFALLVTLSGCSGGDAEGETKKFIEQLNALSDAIEKKDEAKAKSVAAELKETEKKLKEIKVTESEKKRIEEKYKEEIIKAGFKLGMAMAKEPEFSKKIDYKPGQ